MSDALSFSTPKGSAHEHVGFGILERTYPVAETAARLFWLQLRGAGGAAGRIGGRLNYDGTITGDPVLARSRDGELFPVACAADLVISGQAWQVAMEREPPGRKLKVRLRYPAAELELAERMLDVAIPQRIAVTSAAASQESLATLYEELRRRGGAIRVSAHSLEELPKFEVAPDGRLVPSKVRLSTTIAAREVDVVVDTMFTETTVTVQVDADREALAQELIALVASTPSSRKPRRGGREVDVSKHDWSDVAGLGPLKQQLEEWVEAPMKNPGLFRHLKLRPPKGLLLVGPPGTGKTLIAKVLAARSSAAFVYATPADLFSMWFGQSEKAVARLFRQARELAKARLRALVFFDEIDGLFTGRAKNAHEASRRIMSQLLTELDGLDELSGVMVIAATNRVGDIDPALLRPGRFDHIVEVGLPDAAAREAILSVHLVNRPTDPLDLHAVAVATDGMSGADLAQAVDRAAYSAARRAAAAAGVELGAMSPELVSTVRLSQADLTSAVEELAKEKREA